MTKGTSVDELNKNCESELNIIKLNLQKIVDNLDSKTVVIASNVAALKVSNGLRYLYGNEIAILERLIKANNLNACTIRPGALSVPAKNKSGSTKGVSFDSAINQCDSLSGAEEKGNVIEH